MKSILSVSAVIGLLFAGGCATSSRPSARALVQVQSSSVALSSSPSSVQKQGKDELALATVLARAENHAFREIVAASVGTSPETVSAVDVRIVPATRLLEVKARSGAPAEGAKIVNAMARQLAEDFEGHPDIKVAVIGLARAPAPTEAVE